jgi:hypothetical protein
MKDVEIGLLIGMNCAKAIKPHEVIPGSGNDPYAIRTILGWGVIGMMGRATKDCSCLSASTRVVLKTTIKEILPEDVTRMFEVEFSEQTSTPDEKISIDDQNFLDQVKQGIHQTEDGHFELPLPFREKVNLPDNKIIVTKRLNGLKGIRCLRTRGIEMTMQVS